MNNIESIIKRIADDAQAQAQQKIDEAQAEAKQILADYEQQAKTLSQQTQERAQKEAAVIAERVESQSGLIRRNMMLQYKRQAIEQAFQKALEVLCAQENDKQVELLSSAAAKYITSDAQVLLNEKDSAAFAASRRGACGRGRGAEAAALGAAEPPVERVREPKTWPP